ncbi:MAG: dihydrofolate reductase [Gammaproteobacteria bacterium]|nr:dihydrofolate reductase [Gammaproteobacteria bacterium]
MAELCLIVAMTPDRVIGINNTLPWHLPRDLQHFKNTTMGCPVIMGRKTWDSIGLPLPGRLNVVVTRQTDLVLEGAMVVNSLEAAIDSVAEQERVFVIGGANIYEQALPLAQCLYLTEVDTTVDGDAWFPQTVSTEWQEEQNELVKADDKNSFDCRFRTLKRIA